MSKTIPINKKQQTVTIDLDKMADVVCGANPDDQVYKISPLAPCDSTEFTKTYSYKRISAIVSPTGKDEIVVMEFVKCLKCGAMKVVK
jgi:NAD-dependent dihydropyrimidine dehydrogenase PreA subunit